MNDISKKTKVKPAVEATSAADNSSVAAPVLASLPPLKAGNAQTLYVTFYDADTLSPLSPDGLTIDVQVGKTSADPTVKRVGSDGLYSIEIPQASPGSAPPMCPGGPTIADTAIAVLSRSQPFQIDCQTYYLQNMTIALCGKMATPVSDITEQTPCSATIPLFKLDQSFTLQFLAYETCSNGSAKDAQKPLNGVEIRATPVATPSPTGRAAVRQAISGLAAGVQPRSVSAKTMDGFAELPGMVPNQMYKMDFLVPRGYLATSLPGPYFHSSCAQTVALPPGQFQRCSEFPTRSVVFVQKECPGTRVSGLKFTANGTSKCLDQDANGVWNLDPGTIGPIEFQAAGKAFTPASINIKNDSPLVFLVEVGDSQTQGAARRRFRFVDEKGVPFAGRRLRLVSPNGQEEWVTCGSEGEFYAIEGWHASCDEDDSGYRLDAFPLLCSEI
jgi:hypothetical protein